MTPVHQIEARPLLADSLPDRFGNALIDAGWRRKAGPPKVSTRWAEAIVEEVRAAVAKWSGYTEQAQVMKEWRKQIQRTFRLDLPRT